jgi:Zn-finger nucleic acid-binding protein
MSCPSSPTILNCNCGCALTISSGYSHAQCNACGSFWFPTPIEQSEDGIVPQNRKTPFGCPRCDTELEVGKIANTEVCFCPTCRGFVIDSESLGGLINARRSTYSGPDDKPTPADFRELEVNGHCPACLKKMEAHHYCGPGNIILDTCMQCKLAWLDHGEISKITRASGQR